MSIEDPPSYEEATMQRPNKLRRKRVVVTEQSRFTHAVKKKWSTMKSSWTRHRPEGSSRAEEALYVGTVIVCGLLYALFFVALVAVLVAI